MRKLKYILITWSITIWVTGFSYGQVVKNNLILGLGYYNDNNEIQYLKAVTKTKINGKFQLVPAIKLNFFINSVSPENLLGRATTNDKGQASVNMLPGARTEWMKSSKQGFIVVSDSSKLYDAVQTNIDLVKSKIKLDTGADKIIIATLLELKDSVWIPVKGVDIRVAVKRLGSELNVSETQTYTTDSLGTVSAEFKQDSLPGDSLGNLILVAKVEDNDIYGNLSTEKKVPWGLDTKYSAAFNHRSLFARRGHSPMWLEWMAYSIIAAVWGVLFYLFIQIRKLKRLGTQT